MYARVCVCVCVCVPIDCLSSLPSRSHWFSAVFPNSSTPGLSWANDTSTSCWATDAAERNGNYYFYLSAGSERVAVVTSTSPHGPWHDPIGKPLLSGGDSCVSPSSSLTNDALLRRVLGLFIDTVLSIHVIRVSVNMRPLCMLPLKSAAAWLIWRLDNLPPVEGPMNEGHIHKGSCAVKETPPLTRRTFDDEGSSTFPDITSNSDRWLSKNSFLILFVCVYAPGCNERRPG